MASQVAGESSEEPEEWERPELLAKVLPYAAPLSHRARARSPQSAQRRLRLRLNAAIAELDASESLLRELRQRPIEQWPLMFDNSPGFHSLALARDLLQASHRTAFDDPAQGAVMARIGVELVDRLDPGLYGERLLADIRGRGWAIIGECNRLAGELKGADAAFRKARRWNAESPDPEEKAFFLYLLGLLRKDQRRFEEAVRLFDRARCLSEEIADREKVARILTSTGVLHLDRGQPEEALVALLEALDWVDETTDPRVQLFARFNAATCLVDLGDALGAREVFEGCRSRECSDSYVRLRARWIEGRIAAGLGEADRAEGLLGAARAEYLELGQYYNSALVSLDLAALYARQRRSAELKALAEEMAAVFVAQDVPAEAIAALACFRQAVEQERANEELVGGVARFLQRARTEPGLRFGAAGRQASR
jgi:tetratricopeptide (TPR) repeat protein